jgi:hypothetical protein
MEAKIKMRQMHCFLDYMRRENKNDELLLRQCISSLESMSLYLTLNQTQ